MKDFVGKIVPLDPAGLVRHYGDDSLFGTGIFLFPLHEAGVPLRFTGQSQTTGTDYDVDMDVTFEVTSKRMKNGSDSRHESLLSTKRRERSTLAAKTAFSKDRFSKSNSRN